MTQDTLIQVAYGMLSLGLCWVLACRIDKMNKGVTKHTVFLQHAMLAVAVFVAWVIGFTRFGAWSSVVLAGGVLQFFLFSLGRWRRHAPDDTVRDELTELPRDSWPHVVGGRK